MSNFPDFPFSLTRAFCDEPIDVAIEVTYYRPPTELKPGQYISPRDPAYDDGEVCFGHAFTVPDGKPVTLSLLEEEAAEAAFWKQMN